MYDTLVAHRLDAGARMGYSAATKRIIAVAIVIVGTALMTVTIIIPLIEPGHV